MPDNILDLLREKDAEAVKRSHRGLLIQPGAIGDCLLSLPLAKFMQPAVGLGGVDILGHTEYVSFFPGRSCVETVRAIESVQLHRLFVESDRFELADRDPLIEFFGDYDWIVTFLGGADSCFEQNLIFTANCYHAAEVISISTRPPEDFSRHIADYYIEQFIRQSGSAAARKEAVRGEVLIKTTNEDICRGRMLLQETGIDRDSELIVIHPGSGGLEKCWCLDNFLSLAGMLRSQGLNVIFLLGPAEQERLSSNDIGQMRDVGKCLEGLSLPEVLAVLTCVDGYVGNDSGITHLAASMGVRTFVVFGPTSPAVYRPIGPAVTVFSNAAAVFDKQPSPALQREVFAGLTAR